MTIDDDVLAAAKGLAAQQNKSIGEVISALSRQALKPATGRRQVRNGVPRLAVRADAVPATPELVNQLRDELP
ncbi:MAG: CopG family transcriptional regulator [Burkholderiaceae bacterium]